VRAYEVGDGGGGPVVGRGEDGDYRDGQLVVRGRDGDYRGGDYRDGQLNSVFIAWTRMNP
jgi:hypothetical protein